MMCKRKKISNFSTENILTEVRGFYMTSQGFLGELWTVLGGFGFKGSLWSMARSVRFSSSDKSILEVFSTGHGALELISTDQIFPELITAELMIPELLLKDPNHSRAQLKRL